MTKDERQLQPAYIAEMFRDIYFVDKNSNKRSVFLIENDEGKLIEVEKDFILWKILDHYKTTQELKTYYWYLTPSILTDAVKLLRIICKRV